jgi:hypothetical protein
LWWKKVHKVIYELLCAWLSEDRSILNSIWV